MKVKELVRWLQEQDQDDDVQVAIASAQDPHRLVELSDRGEDLELVRLEGTSGLLTLVGTQLTRCTNELDENP